MSHRSFVQAVLVSVVLLLLAASQAFAKGRQFDHLIVEGPGLEDGVTVTRTEVESRLSEGDLSLLYWPIFNDPFKGDERPAGDLGSAYKVTYVWPSSNGDLEISGHETVYPFADPPVAFTPRGQRQDFSPTDGRDYRIPWGWRPFPEKGAALISEVVDRGSLDTVMPRVEAEPSSQRAWPVGPALVLLILMGATVGCASLFFRQRRQVQS